MSLDSRGTTPLSPNELTREIFSRVDSSQRVNRLAGFDQSVIDSEQRQLKTAGHADFVEDISEMMLHRVLAQ